MSRHQLDVHLMTAVGQEAVEPPRGGGGADVILLQSQTLNSAARVAQ